MSRSIPNKTFYRLDPGFLLVLLMVLIAIWPFISRPSLPAETDAELHIFRLHELTLLLRGGEIYPRWAPNFYHGYGYPIFNYYAPLSYYLGFLLSFWPGLDAVAGVKFVFVLGLLAAAIGTYGFVRDQWGREAGWIATAVYIYAPYVQYVDPHARGVLAESLSFGLFPLALWALSRFQTTRSRLSFFLTVVLTTAVILSHNLMGLLFFSILMGWSVWLIVFTPKENRDAWPLLALLLGVMAASFYWLPVFWERNAVNLNTLLGEGDNFDFRTHFLSLRELFAPSLRLDWGATEPKFRFNLGLAQWVLGGIGIVGLLMQDRGREGMLRRPFTNKTLFADKNVAFFVLSFFLLLGLMLPLSEIVWESVPLLPFFQFPWRLMGAAAFMLAVLAGVGCVVLLRQTSYLSMGTAVAVAVPMLFGMLLSQPAPWPDFGEVNSLRMSLIEHEGRWLGTTSTADFVPATVDIVPERNGNVVAGFYDGQPLDRVNRATLPEGATVTLEVIRPLHWRYHVQTPKNSRLRLFLFDFPGWQAEVDGIEVETELGRPEGFLIVPVPQGDHIVDVRFGTTFPRQVGFYLSWGAVLVTAVLTFFQSRRLANGRRWLPIPRLLWTAVIGINLLFIFLLNPTGLLHFNSDDYQAEPAQVAVDINFGDQIRLIGLDGARETAVRPGTTLPITLYWQAADDLNINYQVFVHLIGPDGTLVAQSDKLNPGEFPTKRWPLDSYVRDEHLLTIPKDASPGNYTLFTGLWVQTEGWRLPIFDESGNQVGDSKRLFEIEVR